ncbi:MAG: hypothetical protein WKF54_07960 [Nocardioidaceae bacterium]
MPVLEAARIRQRGAAAEHPTRPSGTSRAAVFVTRRWRGEPVVTDEIIPTWYDVIAIPFGATRRRSRCRECV